MSNYPAVACSLHGETSTGYVCCIHVAEEGARISQLVKPSASRLGGAFCRNCANDPAPPDGVIVICLTCFAELTAA